MASRYPESQVLDYCSTPILISKNGVSNYVPCGHCSGCLLHSSNLWSQRLSKEIEDSAYSIFFTLTYNNEYLPKLKISFDFDHDGKRFYQYFTWFRNFRFVPRINEDGIVTSGYDARRSEYVYFEDSEFFRVPITNFVSDPPFSSEEFIPYPSKNDIVLWLKNVRKSLNNRFKNGKPTFRYYIISELGGEKYRPHYHGIIFCQDREWSDYLKQYALYACWQMCDKTLFDDNTKYCNAATARYLTEYVTIPADLPRVYKHSSTKNFRLVSKSPAIGFRGFEKEKVQEAVCSGTLQYDRSIHRLGQFVMVRYPSNYISALFPKCRGFSRLSFDRLLSVYGYLYKEIYERGRQYTDLYNRLSTLDPVTFNAQRACLRYCEELGFDAVFHYCFMLDNVYYLTEMARLSQWYHWQESQDDLFVILASYYNFEDYVLFYYEQYNIYNKYFSCFLYTLSLPFVSELPKFVQSLKVPDFIELVRDARKKVYPDAFDNECSDILQDACKMRNYNELVGLDPHIV